MDIRAHYAEGAAPIKATLDKALASSAANNPVPFLSEVIKLTLQGPSAPVSNDIGNAVFDALHDAIQEPTEENVIYASALAYTDQIKFAGYAPRFSMNPVVPKNEVEDVEPVFDVWVRDEHLCPDSTLALRVAFTRSGAVSIAPVNLEFLSQSAAATVEAPTKPKSKGRSRSTAKPKKAAKVK